MIKESQPALAFILDNLLPPTESNPDRECSSAARILIAALSSATDSPLAQYTVVAEVKCAICRALAWPEVVEKHQQLQILTGLIPTMIENFPPEYPALMKIHQYQPRRNDIFFIIVRKGLITDLAKITQNLDLSSPHTFTTINAVLKSLEILLRMSNQPGLPSILSKKKTPTRRLSSQAPGEAGAEGNGAGEGEGEGDGDDMDESGAGDRSDECGSIDPHTPANATEARIAVLEAGIAVIYLFFFY